MVNGLPDKNISSITYDQNRQAPAGYQHRHGCDLRQPGRRAELAPRA